MATGTKLRVGTRESKLARWQTDRVIAALTEACPGNDFEIVSITTSGDKILNKPISEIGSTGVFVKELEDALINNEVDFVVHSLKDVPTTLPEGLVLGALLCRDDPRDVLVSKNGLKLQDLPDGSKVATSSRRRIAQLSALRPTIEFVEIRGNVPTRLRKMEEGLCDAVVLAAAGLIRLGFSDRITQFLEADQCLPAAGQGALAVEMREGDEGVAGLLSAIHESDVSDRVVAERAFLRVLGGGCSVPVGVHATISQGKLELSACIADGTTLYRDTISGARHEGEIIGVRLAERMLAQGAAGILDNVLKRPQQPISPP